MTTKRKTRSGTAGRADEMFAGMLPVVERVPEGDAELTRDYLRTYCWLCAQIEDLEALIDRDGVIVTEMVGNNSYAREKQVENPALKTLDRLMRQKTAYYSKLHKVLAPAYDDTDELDEWLDAR